jgi:uncharacterized protein
MTTWVFDTNVIVSAHLSPFGPPALLLGEVLARRLRLAYDVRILDEYGEVLSRPKFDLPRATVERFLEVMADQEFVHPVLLDVDLSDPSDAMFLEVAAALPNPVLVSGNLAHFPGSLCATVEVLSPATALQKFRKECG